MRETLRQRRHSELPSLVWRLDGQPGESSGPSLEIRVGFSVESCLSLHVWRRSDAPHQTGEQVTTPPTSGGFEEDERGHWTCRSPKRSFSA